LLYCSTQYETKKEGLDGPFDFHRSWNSKFRKQWRADGVQYIKNARTEPNDAFGSIYFNDLESNEEKNSLALAGKKLRFRI
jgi:hypothetical protein